MVILVFLFAKFLNKNRFLLEKNNINLLYFLIEVKIYFFFLKILQIFLFFSILTVFLSLIFDLLGILSYFLKNFLIIEAKCAGAQKLMQTQYENSKVYYNFHQENKIQISENYKYLLNSYIKDKNSMDLSIFNSPYIKGVNSIYQNSDNIFKILNQVQVNILSMTNLHNEIIDSIIIIGKQQLEINSDFN